jgi:hypothetical protein
MLVLTAALLLVALTRGFSGLAFAFQMFLLTLMVCAIPLFVESNIGEENRVGRIIFETLSFGITLACFSIWMLDIAGLQLWIVYALLLILLLEIGSHIVQAYQKKVLRRIASNTQLHNLHGYSEKVESIFCRELGGLVNRCVNGI